MEKYKLPKWWSQWKKKPDNIAVSERNSGLCQILHLEDFNAAHLKKIESFMQCGQ